MINWKIFAMMSHVNEKGRLVPIVTMTHEETVQDSDSREEAFDEFDAFCGIAKETGEIRYERDDDDTERTPVYTRYERYWVKE